VHAVTVTLPCPNILIGWEMVSRYVIGLADFLDAVQCRVPCFFHTKSALIPHEWHFSLICVCSTRMIIEALTTFIIIQCFLYLIVCNAAGTCCVFPYNGVEYCGRGVKLSRDQVHGAPSFTSGKIPWNILIIWLALNKHRDACEKLFTEITSNPDHKLATLLPPRLFRVTT
jgi:hypothetical protein